MQKCPFSISELVHIRFFNALASFQLTLTGTNKFVEIWYSCLVKAYRWLQLQRLHPGLVEPAKF